MIRPSVKRLSVLIPVAAILLGALLLSGCGASSLKDSETATDAQAAESVAAAAAADTAAATTEAPTTTEAATTAALAADNSGSWTTIKDGAQTFAAQLDQANQSVASCQTDAAAGANFDACMGKAYTTIATAATTLVGTVDQVIMQTDGQCHEALTTLRGATQSMADDYTTAVSTTDLTSQQTLEARLGDDAQAYADNALTAAAACIS